MWTPETEARTASPQWESKIPPGCDERAAPGAYGSWMPSPKRSSLPARARIREVGPRDGFQNEPERIDTADKIRLIDALCRTGLQRVEVTSFVRADFIPQLADAGEVLAGIDAPPGVS